jgi:hypothetical protein
MLGAGPVLNPGTKRSLAGVADWYFFVTLALAAPGLLALARAPNRPQGTLVLTAALALLIVPLLLWGNPRFHMPLVPFIALSAAGTARAAAGAVSRAFPRGTPARR